jgi:creatinine amidohydrolase
MDHIDSIPCLAELTSPAVARLVPSDWLVVWPVASLEQHGPHLPLGTDAIVLDALVNRVRATLGSTRKALFLPMLQIGKSPEHLGFPGTISVRASTLIAIAEDVVSSCVSHGFRHFVFLNGHGGNTALLQGIAQDLRQQHDALVYSIDLWPAVFTKDLIESTFPDLMAPEVHAASAETSMLLYLHPELVGNLPQLPEGQAVRAREVTEKLGQVPWGWLSEDFGAAGVIGDPTWASAKAGERLLASAAMKICDLLAWIPTPSTAT